MVIMRKSGEEEVSSFYDVLLEESLRFLSQWEMNGGIQKEGGIIIWLSSQNRDVRAGKQAMVQQE